MYNVTHLHNMQNITSHDMVFPGSHNKNTSKQHFRKASVILNDHPRQRERTPAQPGRYKDDAWAQGSTARIQSDSPTARLTMTVGLFYPKILASTLCPPILWLTSFQVARLFPCPPIAWLTYLSLHQSCGLRLLIH